jgi:hypothetical protein
MSGNENLPVISGFEKSPTIGELTKALANAHKQFKPVLKDANNPFFKSKYADLAGVIEATADALSDQGLAVIQSPGKIYNGHILLTTLLSHASGEWIKDELELPIAKFDAQGTGSAITYARRYAYQAIVGVAAEDDDGNAASQKFEKQGDNFVRKTDSPVTAGQGVNVPNLPVAPVTVGKLPELQKPVARKKKESVPDAGKPWAGLAGVNATKQTNEVFPGLENVGYTPPQDVKAVSNTITPENPITDADVIFPGDPEPPVNPGKSMVGENPARLATDDERKAFMARLIKLKDKGFTGIREYLLKESGVQITNDIPVQKMNELVARLEAAESEGKLKELLGGK